MHTVSLKPGFRAAFRIEFDELDFPVGYGGEERDVVVFVHRMIHGNVIFILAPGNHKLNDFV